MRNKITFLFLVIFVGFSSTIFSQQTSDQDYSIIYLVRSGESIGSRLMCSIFIANQSPFNIAAGEVVAFKVYSEGEVSLGAQYNMGKGNLFCNVKVKRGKEYYVYLESNDFTEVEEKKTERFKKFLSKKETIEHKEENLDLPIYPNTIHVGRRNGKGQGSCFLISSDGYFITNFHCVENSKELFIKGIDGDFTTKYGALVVASDPSNDLALLKISNKNLKFNAPVYGLKTSGVLQAEKVYALGYPIAATMGNEIKINEGIISSKSGVKGDVSKFQISAAVNPGNSGGPLIDENGNLIGVIYAKSTVAESAGYAIKASYLEAFLKNSEGFIFPNFNNSLKGKTTLEQINEIKSFVFIIESN